jgi:hypothetical protein
MPQIPTPSELRMVEAATVTMLMVRAKGKRVIYYYDCSYVKLFIVDDRSEWVTAGTLSGAIKAGKTIGREVASTVLACGGGASEDYTVISGDAKDHAAMLDAIEHFNANVLDKRPERGGLRAIHRLLVKAQTDRELVASH